MKELVEFVNGFPQGVSPGDIEKHFGLSRTTLNRRLKQAVAQGALVVSGKGPATRYVSADPLSALRLYFEKPHTERVLAPYREELLTTEPGLTEGAGKQLLELPGFRLDKRTLSRFLIDFSCASSVLEGGTYSLLDTQALIEYGEKANDKPLGDAFLVLNHKKAFEYLYDNLHLGAIYRVHELLTDDHDMPELANSPHFLEKPFRGVPREYTDCDIALSAYLPPFRPGTGYIGAMLEQVLKNAEAIESPVQAAFYLLTRLPYLQPFQDGNKRTSRALCNVPLLLAGLPPVSFVDFSKRDYIVSLLAFYELGDVRLAERCFVQAYFKSMQRLGVKS